VFQCSTKPKFNLNHACNINNIPILIDNSKQIDVAKFKNTAEEMSQMLLNLSDVFGVSRDSIVIYLGEASEAAFNSNNMIHFNLLFYNSLHHNYKDVNSWIYWFIVYAHQLAHNVFPEHSPQHDMVMCTIMVHTFEGLFQILQSQFPVVGMGDCKICFEKKIDVVVLECGHLAICSSCVKNVNKCPICRKAITRVQQVYLQ